MRSIRGSLLVLSAVLAFAGRGSFAGAQDLVTREVKISSEPGSGFSLPDFTLFGISVCRIGDVDGDGVDDVATGAYVEADGGPERGAVYIFFMKPDGTWKSFQKISSTQGGFTAVIDDGDGFGNSLAPLGDFDGDGVPDLVVGNWLDDDGGCCPGADRGALFLLFLMPDGTVKDWRKISSVSGNMTASAIDDGDRFGQAVCNLGDLDGDGVVDLAVGALYDGDGKSGPNTAVNSGAVYVLFLTPQGTVRSWSKISNLFGNFGATLQPQDRFGYSCATIPDLDGDGVVELAAGAFIDAGSGFGQGAAYVLFLTPQGTVKSYVEHSGLGLGSEPPNLLANVLDDSDYFSAGLAAMPDLDGDGLPELVVGAIGDDDDVVPDSEANAGGVYVLFLRADGKEKGHAKISLGAGGFTGTIENNDRFGQSVAYLGDIDGDGHPELGVGAIGDDDGGPERGALWLLSLRPGPVVQLEGALPAGNGLHPRLTVAGSLVAGAPTTITLDQAAPSAPTLLFASALPSYLPLLGGVLVPSVNLPAAALPFVTDGTGALAFTLPWPAGIPANMSIWLQAWIGDASAIQGASASNGVLLTMP